jgi:hypothetical protein
MPLLLILRKRIILARPWPHQIDRFVLGDGVAALVKQTQSAA